MRAVIQGMTKRTIEVELLGTELHHIYKTFKNNGYPPRMVYSVIQQTLATPTKPQRETITGPKILLPYYRGLSEKIQRLGRPLNFSVCYTRGPNLRSLFRSDNVRVLPEEHPAVVYEQLTLEKPAFPSDSRNMLDTSDDTPGPKKTSRTAVQPPRHHMADCLQSHRMLQWSVRWRRRRLPNTLRTAPALYKRVSYAESHLSRRRIKEAFFIQHNECINRDNGKEICDIWNGLVNITNCCNLD
ncbi:hypothetical protein M513_10601 [Trichuris suis]|uniref:Uncharacterized protein n=1 Tax=Trichuris suis TaxID=68888 RepID=A0A085LU78_9BILA|nr:hypothetical protein M513_10601 [Trichuris suis]